MIGTGANIQPPSTRRSHPTVLEGLEKPCIAFVIAAGRTDDLLDLLLHHGATLRASKIVASDPAAALLDEVGLDVERLPGEGLSEIGRMVMRGEVNLAVHLGRRSSSFPPHEIQAMQALCDLHQVPFATNAATAQLLLLFFADWELPSASTA